MREHLEARWNDRVAPVQPRVDWFRRRIGAPHAPPVRIARVAGRHAPHPVGG